MNTFINSSDLYITQTGNSPYVASNYQGFNSELENEVRYNSFRNCLEYRRRDQETWYEVPGQNFNISLPPALFELVNWARDNQQHLNARNPVPELLDWVKRQRELMYQHQQFKDQNAALAEAWDRVTVALDQYQMLLNLCKPAAA